MAIRTIVQTFRETVNNSNEVEQFIYGKVWDLNGKPNWNYPAILLESQPDWVVTKQRSGGLPSMKEYTLKVFYFDEYWISEQTANNQELDLKQAEAEGIVDRYLNQLATALLLQGIQLYTEGKEGFHGYFSSTGQHNSSLIEVFQKVKLIVPANCP